MKNRWMIFLAFLTPIVFQNPAEANWITDFLQDFCQIKWSTGKLASPTVGDPFVLDQGRSVPLRAHFFPSQLAHLEQSQGWMKQWKFLEHFNSSDASWEHDLLSLKVMMDLHFEREAYILHVRVDRFGKIEFAISPWGSILLKRVPFKDKVIALLNEVRLRTANSSGIRFKYEIKEYGNPFGDQVLLISLPGGNSPALNNLFAKELFSYWRQEPVTALLEPHRALLATHPVWNHYLSFLEPLSLPSIHWEIRGSDLHLIGTDPVLRELDVRFHYLDDTMVMRIRVPVSQQQKFDQLLFLLPVEALHGNYTWKVESSSPRAEEIEYRLEFGKVSVHPDYLGKILRSWKDKLTR